jgi:rare lipoprotein A (peptidoglycan hydrolase)
MKLPKPVASILLLVAAGCAALYISQPHPTAVIHAAPQTVLTTTGEPTDRTPEVYQGSFMDDSLQSMLTHLNITVYPEDKVFTFLDPSLRMGSRIHVYRAQTVLINDSGEEKLVRTWAPTVAALAEEQHLDLAEKDIVVPDVSATIPIQSQPVTVSITRVAVSNLQISTAIPNTTQYKDDPTLEKGINTTEVKGVAGTLRTTYTITRQKTNGVWKEVSRVKIKTERLVEPVTEIIRRGTKIVELDRGIASFYRQCGTNRFTAAHKTLPKGTRVHVINLANGKSVDVVIDDRGPYVAGRVIDLSCDAFAAIGSTGSGVISVRVEKL